MRFSCSFRTLVLGVAALLPAGSAWSDAVSREDQIKAALMGRPVTADDVDSAAANPLAAREPHFSPRAKRVVWLFMDGGPSHIDSFDPKPGHANQGATETVKTRIPGVRLAASLPEMARRMGDLCVVRSMTSKEGNHSRAKYLLHAGYPPNPNCEARRQPR